MASRDAIVVTESGGGLCPFDLLQIILHLLRMGATENEYLLDSDGFESSKCVFDHRNVRQGQQHLNGQHEN